VEFIIVNSEIVFLACRSIRHEKNSAGQGRRNDTKILHTKQIAKHRNGYPHQR